MYFQKIAKILTCLCLMGPGLQAQVHPDAQFAEGILLNEKLDGFRGIWYANQPNKSEFVYKYGGGLGTYTANHNPLAIYAESVKKTFFCYGAENEAGSLIYAISYFDHNSQTVAQPTAIFDKKTNDAHDNPAMSIDSDGYIWIFGTSHGIWRPSYILKSKYPYEINEFEQVEVTKLVNGEATIMDNFSYLQVYHSPEKGFIGLFTHYVDKQFESGKKMTRVIAWMKSKDGKNWSEWKDIASIDEGHYQTSFFSNGKLSTSFNYHPYTKGDIGLNYRTNLYYLATEDYGNSWKSADGKIINLPLTEEMNAALVRDYRSEGLLVYINDVMHDENGYPVILYITSKGFDPGPENNPRTWNLASWNGNQWDLSKVTESDSNYDMGSIFIDKSGDWVIVGPTEPGPQKFNTGGEMAMWKSKDKGKTWKLHKQLTRNSEQNHSYARKPLLMHPDFVAFWADGHGRKPSESRLYFTNSKGQVFQLPWKMESEFVRVSRMKMK
ncbi:BNR-4 repeat-containing protein [Aquiflexum sp.]|uniref:BNR-4 repeat-containing protein n=1 Tax=Aquiflexum sp. TaxID=1872584 RepID=UPI0035934834